MMIGNWRLTLGLFIVVWAALGDAPQALADSITFSGLITQSTGDGTGPASNNTSLNNINDGDAYSVTIDFPSSITSTGLYPLTLITMDFSDLAASASETSFNSASVTVSADGGLFDVSILGCLSTGSGCSVGNQLDANFSIPMAGLTAHGVTAAAIPSLVPSMDLLEDDGVTDIQGSVTGYDYSGAVAPSPTPEPSALMLLSAAMGALAFFQILRRNRGVDTHE